jgi:16S rRNA (cytosine967-C5)-methyltransferase
MSTWEPSTFSHAAHVLAEAGPDNHADVVLRRYFVSHAWLGARERRAISKAVFIAYRWRNWVGQERASEQQVQQACQMQDKFDRDPKSVKVEALAARAIPEWVKSELELSDGFLREIQRDPTLWLRAKPGTAPKLANELGHCVIFGHDALNYRGAQDLFLTEQFHKGAFEIQDLASQWVGWVADPQPGQLWWDACAGEGGKTLHLADLMQNKGVVWASDRSERRLQVLQKRAKRASLFNVRVAEGTPRGSNYDGVLVDAPCSGLGTWQRNPHARWTTTPQDVEELAAVQMKLLNSAAVKLKTGGKLVYAVCTLTRSETFGVAEAFSAAHPQFQSLPVAPPKGEASAEGALQPGRLLWPQEFHSNGMYVAAWQKT